MRLYLNQFPLYYSKSTNKGYKIVLCWRIKSEVCAHEVHYYLPFGLKGRKMVLCKHLRCGRNQCILYDLTHRHSSNSSSIFTHSSRIRSEHNIVCSPWPYIAVTGKSSVIEVIMSDYKWSIIPLKKTLR